jgi:hypothetical protein
VFLSFRIAHSGRSDANNISYAVPPIADAVRVRDGAGYGRIFLSTFDPIKNFCSTKRDYAADKMLLLKREAP